MSVSIPDIKNPAWEMVISKEETPDFQFLATRILVGQLVSEYDDNTTPEKLSTCIKSLRDFFEKNIENPKVRDDLKKIFDTDNNEMPTKLMSVEKVVRLIRAGKRLVLAGDEGVLSKLPAGNWIGGTIPYFMDSDGGKYTQKRIYVTEIPNFVIMSKTVVYTEQDIHKVYTQSPKTGFSIIILPSSSDVHSAFSLNCPKFDQFATKPLIGWVSGVDVNDIGKITPKVYDGRTSTPHEHSAVVMHVVLPSSKRAEVNIVNIFEQGEGAPLTFPLDGFYTKDVIINGERLNFAAYLKEEGVDTRLPLVADMFGAQINTSFQSVEENRVDFYAPVYAGIQYRIAKPFKDYVRQFSRKIPKGVRSKTIFSCNCILNYLYAELEGKRTPGFTGPVTFGEVAYQLLNQTMVYLTIEDV